MPENRIDLHDEIVKSGRSCGSCAACCTLLGIPEINKPVRTMCPFLVRKSSLPCGWYETRPQSCRDFVCGWLAGLMADQDRPDRLGAVIYTQKEHIQIHPVAYRSFKPRLTRWLTHLVTSGVPVIVVMADGEYDWTPNGMRLRAPR